MPIIMIRVLDVESTGLAPPEAEVIEVGWSDLWFDTDRKTSVVEPPKSRLFGAARGVPPEASAVHHLTAADLDGLPVIDASDFASCAQDGAPYALAAHSWAMEGQWFTPERLSSAHVICTLKAAKRAWEDAPGHSNSVLRYWRGLRLAPDLAMPPHRAGPDAYVTAHLLADLLKTERVADLVRWSREPMHYATCPIGKHRGARWAEIPHSYLKWMTDQADMEFDLKFAARTELNRRAEEGVR